MFTWNKSTRINSSIGTRPVKNAIDILCRDMDKVLKSESKTGGEIVLQEDDTLQEEQYRIEISANKIYVFANDDLGWVYGILTLSEKYLGVKPFWFWMDQHSLSSTIHSQKRPQISFRRNFQ